MNYPPHQDYPLQTYPPDYAQQQQQQQPYGVYPPVAQDAQQQGYPQMGYDQGYNQQQQPQQPYYDQQQPQQPYYDNQQQPQQQPYYDNQQLQPQQPYYDNQQPQQPQPYYDNQQPQQQPYYDNQQQPQQQPQQPYLDNQQQQPYLDIQQQPQPQQPYYDNQQQPQPQQPSYAPQNGYQYDMYQYANTVADVDESAGFRGQMFSIYQNQMAPQKFEVPKGMKVTHNERGVPYLVPQDEKEQQHAEQEYASKRLGACAGLSQIEEEYGLTLRLYFEFQYILIFLNLVFFLIQLVNFIWYLSSDTKNIGIRAKSFATFPGIFYSSNYPSTMIWIWRVTNVVTMVVMLLSGPAYYMFCTLLFTKRKIVDHEQTIADDESDTIEANRDISTGSRILRVSLSYLVAIASMLVNLVIIAAVTIAQNYAVLAQSIVQQFGAATKLPIPNHWIILGFSIVVSIIITISKKAWGWIAERLNKFERHSTWSSYRNHETFKLTLFNLVNLAIAGFAKGFFTNPCVLEIIGNQYFTQLVIDIVVFNTLELVMPFITYFIKSRCHKGNMDDIRPEFNISDEYFELIYRQNTVFYALPAFPLIGFIAIWSFVIELITDKIRLLKFCKKPPRMNGSFKTLVAFFLLLSAILTIGNPGSGVIYFLIGQYWCNGESNQLKCTVCPIFIDQCVRNGTSTCFVRAIPSFGGWNSTE